MSYIKSMYGDRNYDFIMGFLSAMDTYAVHMNGKRYIGSPEIELQKAEKAAVIELGGKVEDYFDLD